MKIVRRQKEKTVLLLETGEKPLLLALLNRYPLIPPAYQPLSKTLASSEAEADQRLLDEALAEQRQENKRQLQALLETPRRFRKVKAGWHLTLSAPDIEWLLQVLNDVRVGSWILLGSPENEVWDFELNERTAPQAWTMEMARYFQAHLLEALREGVP